MNFIKYIKRFHRKEIKAKYDSALGKGHTKLILNVRSHDQELCNKGVFFCFVCVCLFRFVCFCIFYQVDKMMNIMICTYPINGIKTTISHFQGTSFLKPGLFIFIFIFHFFFFWGGRGEGAVLFFVQY